MSLANIENKINNLISKANKVTGRTSLTLTHSVNSLIEGYGKLSQIIDKTVTEITAEDLATATKIGNYVFYGCSGLTSITIPDSVTSIGESAFYGCTNLTDIYVPWNEGDVAGAPWGATNATVHYERPVFYLTHFGVKHEYIFAKGMTWDDYSKNGGETHTYEVSDTVFFSLLGYKVYEHNDGVVGDPVKKGDLIKPFGEYITR